jgi:hypothetical protein
MMRFRYHYIKSITKNLDVSQPIDTAAICRGGEHSYAAQESPKIDTARKGKVRFRMETI